MIWTFCSSFGVLLTRHSSTHSFSHSHTQPSHSNNNNDDDKNALPVGSWKPIVYGAVSSAACEMWTIPSQVFAMHFVAFCCARLAPNVVVFFFYDEEKWWIFSISRTHTHTHTLGSQPIELICYVYYYATAINKCNDLNGLYDVITHMTCAHIVVLFVNIKRCVLFVWGQCFEFETFHVDPIFGSHICFRATPIKRN